MIYHFILGLIGAIIAVIDIKYKKIPNKLIILGVLVVFINDFITAGQQTIIENSIGLLLGFLAFIILWGVIAAGDVKLLILISMVVGIKGAWLVFIMSTIVAMFFFVLKNPIKIKEKVKRTVYRYIYQIGVSKSQKELVIAYSPFILVALAIYLVVRGV